MIRRSHAPDSAPDAWLREALVFSTNFRQGFDPRAFQAVLPKDLIHRVVEGELIHALFAVWKQAAALTASQRVCGARAWFVASALQIAQAGYAVNLRPHWPA